MSKRLPGLAERERTVIGRVRSSQEPEQALHVTPQRTNFWSVAAVLFALKLYVLALLYVAFLQTEVRNGDKGFIVRERSQSMETRTSEIESSFWERLAPYDGQWYLDIAKNGYRELEKIESRRGMHPAGNYAFFPLLPFLINAVSAFSEAHYLCGTIIALVALSSLGLAITWLLARELQLPALLSVALLIAFPTAVFQFALYTEGLFLFLSALTLLAARKGHMTAAAIAGAFAGLTRPQGVLLVLPLFAEFVLPRLRTYKARGKLAVIGSLATTLTPLSGFVAQSICSLYATGSLTGFLAIQGKWGRSYSFSGFLSSFDMAFGYEGPPTDLLGLAFGVLLLPVIWKKLPLSFALYGTATLLLPLATGSILSLGRFLSVSIPHFLALAIVLQRTPIALRAGVVAAFAVAQMMLARGFLAWCLVG